MKSAWWVDLENPNDSELIEKIKEFNNSKTADALDDYKNASEYMFKACTVKKWVVYKRTLQTEKPPK